MGQSQDGGENVGSHLGRSQREKERWCSGCRRMNSILNARERPTRCCFWANVIVHGGPPLADREDYELQSK